MTGHKQTTDGEEYETDYTYNLSGALIEQTYPSGRVVKNILDNDGDLSIVQSRKSENHGYWNYANSFTYNAAGAVTSMHLGNGRWESTQFNSRLQPTQIALGVTPGATNLLKLNYSYGSTNNNGNVLTQQITVKRPSQSDLVFDQTYTYDSLNRLKSAEEVSDSLTTWKQVYTFDPYGNRNFDEEETTTLVKNCGTDPNFTVCAADKKVFNPDLNPANNRMASGQDYTYDAAGNVTVDAEGRQFSYDAENKQKEVKNSLNDVIGQYFFDGDGKRVKKVVPLTGEVTVFVYDAGAKLIGEYSTVVEMVSPKVQYLTNDHLGSPRINTDENGNITSRTDYMPYGEEIIALGNRTSNESYVTDDVRQGFTGYENDSETGLDYAQARYFSKAHGRFTSSDPIYITQRRLNDPQQINLYAYVRNNPLTLIDPTGLDFEFTGKDKKKFVQDVNNRQDSQFKVKLNKNGIVEVVNRDKVDVNKLSKSEKAFFEAINDTENRATLTGVSKDAKIDFGGFIGDGVNQIDASDMSLLRKADKSVAGHVIAHEMMEAYASAKSGSNDFDAMHIEASKTFSEAIPTNGQRLPGEENAAMLSGAIVDYSINRNGKSTGIQVSYKFLNKEPVRGFNKTRGKSLL